MDELDIKICNSMVTDFGSFKANRSIRKSNLGIARELDIDEGTVRNRVEKLADMGFIRGRHVIPNPKAMGMIDVHLRVEVTPPSAKEDAIKKMKLAGGVFLVRDYLGSALGLDFFCDDERTLQRETELISRIANAEEVATDVMKPSASSFNFDADDVAIVSSIRDSPRKPYWEIARETGMSIKRVKRKFNRMVEADALFVTVDLDFRAANGIIKGDLLVYYDEAARRTLVDPQLLRILGNRCFAPHLDSDGIVACSVFLHTVSEQREIVEAIKKLDGVARVYMDIVVEQVCFFQSLHEQLLKYPLPNRSVAPRVRSPRGASRFALPREMP